MKDPVRIGVSACLIGNRVRYDGGYKLDRFLVDTLDIPLIVPVTLINTLCANTSNHTSAIRCI